MATRSRNAPRSFSPRCFRDFCAVAAASPGGRTTVRRCGRAVGHHAPPRVNPPWLTSPLACSARMQRTYTMYYLGGLRSRGYPEQQCGPRWPGRSLVASSATINNDVPPKMPPNGAAEQVEATVAAPAPAPEAAVAMDLNDHKLTQLKQLGELRAPECSPRLNSKAKRQRTWPLSQPIVKCLGGSLVLAGRCGLFPHEWRTITSGLPGVGRFRSRCRAWAWR